MRFWCIPIGEGEIGCVFDVSGWENMEPAGFFMYPCRGVLHTPRNNPRRRFGSKTGRVLGVSLLGRVKSGRFLAYPYWENVKPAKFFIYPCRAQKHTPPNVLRRRFGSKIGCVFGVSGCGNMKPGGFCTHPCRGVLHTPRNNPRRRFRSKIGQDLDVSLLGRVKSGAFWAYPYWEG